MSLLLSTSNAASAPLSGNNPPGNRVMRIGNSGTFYGFHDGSSNVSGIGVAFGMLDNKAVGAFTISALAIGPGNNIYLDFTVQPANTQTFSIYIPDFQLAAISVAHQTALGFATATVTGITAWAQSRLGLDVTCSVSQI